ncbi:MAG: bifunctional oligoribonuclease/PAP phosphatase NrnA [Nitratiruptor sp.]|nr:bifunctional oligoribonuclease/PAP phosphatase NrnA [Nitratiruptor sp.]NPA82860.1 bifunctional oligoribonuclease/PAP phosphatase NrnA [Campylobacterota bacterium]
MAGYLHEDRIVSYQRCWQAIQEAGTILLASHINPDPDTIGSALGLYHLLRAQGKRTFLHVPSPLPYNLDFLPGIEKFRPTPPDHYDLIVALDAASWDRLGLGSHPEAPLIVIDHHRSNQGYGQINLIEPDFAATAQVVYQLLRVNDLPIPAPTAICLYTGLVDDCGFFRFESVDERVFEMAAYLCRHGANPHFIARNLTMREPLAKIRLTQRLLETLELHHHATIATLTLTQEILKATGATKEMADSVLDMARSLATVQVAILFKEEEDRRYKVSLRSKGEVDVARIAAHFGGGGHRSAAGFTDGSDLSWLKGELLAYIQKEIAIETE